MLSFRQFLECNDIDTSHTKGTDLGSLGWQLEEAYRMYSVASAHELQNDYNYTAYVPAPVPAPADEEELKEGCPF